MCYHNRDKAFFTEERGKSGMKMETLGQTLDCGQSFRWAQSPDGTWEGVACGRYLRITKENLSGVLRDRFWANYFDMGLDYGKIRAGFCAADPVLSEAACYAPDIRILNQDPWEALCSFILSQCNNIKRIKGIVARLCSACGEPIDELHRAFPTPEALAREGENGLRHASRRTGKSTGRLSGACRWTRRERNLRNCPASARKSPTVRCFTACTGSTHFQWTCG